MTAIAEVGGVLLAVVGFAAVMTAIVKLYLNGWDK